MYDDIPASGVVGTGLLAMTGLADMQLLLVVALLLVAAGAATLVRRTQ